MKGILFRPFLVNQINKGVKTQTRRILSPENVVLGVIEDEEIRNFVIAAHAQYKKGEVIYIREAFRVPAVLDKVPPSEILESPVEFKSGGTINCKDKTLRDPGRWRSPLHLPAHLARYFIKINNVRLEQLSDINDDDCISEGIEITGSDGYFTYYKIYSDEIPSNSISDPVISFFTLWNSVHGAGAFSKNPYVFAYDFVKCDKQGLEVAV